MSGLAAVGKNDTLALGYNILLFSDGKLETQSFLADKDKNK